jgi:hypothetical protein
MLQYKSEYLRDPYIKGLNRRLHACYKYEIVDANENVSTVYTSDSITLVYCSNMLIRVERNRRMFSKPHHLIYDNTSDEQLGVFEFPEWQNAATTSCILRLNTGKVYSFIENKDHKRFFKPSTWGRYRFEMTNSENCIIYDGDRETGSITSSDKAEIIPIALGFFIIDDKFRSSEETAG